jgi:DNA topoisomerase I
MTSEEIIASIKKVSIKKVANDPEKTAHAVNLEYVTDDSPGISRKKNGKTFIYFFGDKKISDTEELLRIKSLVLPPAWEKVWICRLPNGHLQATGFDARNRKQYRYHPLWNALRNQTKFYRMIEFGKCIPGLREQVKKDLALPGMPREKILATVVSLMEHTNIRVGNNVYEKLYGSFGLTTLKDNHITIKGNQIKFSFRGKKGIMHEITLKNKKLASIVQKAKEIPGKELFQYYGDDGQRHAIDSGMVNTYIKEITGLDFTAKDFRTWAGTVNALVACKEAGVTEDQAATKKKVVEILDKVAEQLGNSRTICKKYYVHPLILSLYESAGLEKYFTQQSSTGSDVAGLNEDEQTVLKILQNNP